MNKPVNTFTEGMNLNLADLVMKSTQSRLCMGMRLIDLDSATYAMTNIRGTEEKFQLTSGYTPLASAEYKNILYILSINPATSIVELGSYPSPDYSGGANYNVYRPFNNLELSVGIILPPGFPKTFRTTIFGYNESSKLKLILQPDYDESINVIIVGKGFPPRIINNKFKMINGIPTVTTDRPGVANSNTYNTATVDKETRLQVFSDKVMKITFTGLQAGGKVKAGNYQYVFYYMTEDFSRTEIVGQSSTCQVAFGASTNNRRGGISTEETSHKVVLSLTNIDTDFRYIKAYALYSSGLDGLEQQYLEFVQPIVITGNSLTFTHNGFETLREVSQEDINTSFYGINSANSGEQIGGRLILGGIQENTVDLQALATGALAMTPEFNVRELPPTALPGYAEPSNVYNFMGNFGGESYPYAVVYMLPGGALSPAFPVKGKLFTSSMSGGNPIVTPTDQNNGVVTFPDSNHYLPWSSSREQVKYMKLDVSGVPQAVKDASIGFFVVRGERRPWLLTQGLVIPTLRVAPVEHIKGGGDSSTDFYYDLFNAGTENTNYKLIPCVDNLLEAYALDEIGTAEDPTFVLDEFFKIAGGYMPIFINDLRQTHGAGTVDNFPTDRWAFISGEALFNEPAYVTSLQREAPYIFQLAKGQFRVKGEITPLYKQDFPAQPTPNVGMHYDLESLTRYTTPGFKLCSELSYVPAETFASGSDFISAVAQRFKFDDDGSGGDGDHNYDVRQMYNSYFGIKTTNALNDATKSALNPQAGNARMNNGGVKSSFDAHTSGVKYINMNSLIPAGFLVNIYSSNVRPTQADLYPTTDDIIYKQITPRYTWAEVASAGNKIDVYGGDAYICKVSRKLYQSGFRNPSDREENQFGRANINSGMMVTWFQESKYNLYLRQPIQFDASETQKRSFFPLQGNGDFLKFRQYRYPETTKGSPGYSEVLAPRSFIPTPTLSPAVRNNFFSRLSASTNHIPNAFRNGYRVFLSTNFKDYDSSMGEIIEMHSLGGRLIIIFEHGIGEIAVDERVLAGRDAAGPVYAEPASFLPTGMRILSSKIGAQDPKAVIKTPQGVYVIDQDKKTIVMVVDKMYLIADETISSYLEQGSITNPRCGYNMKYKEVVFTTDNWTLVFREGANKFTAFYPYIKPYYALRGNEFYAFNVPALSSQGAFHLMDSANTRLIFGEEKECFVEFVVNEGATHDKVFELLELVSNEVRPSKIEFFSYNMESKRVLVLTADSCKQYAKVQDAANPFTDDNNIPFNKNRFVITIPKTEIYNGELDSWGIGGRIRNKAMIVRITYQTSDPVQLMGAITTVKPIF